MRNASGPAQGKMSGSEKKSEQEHVRTFLHKPCNQEVSKFLDVSRCSRAEQRRSVLHVQNFFFFLLLFFHRSRCLPRLALHDFIFSLSKI